MGAHRSRTGVKKSRKLPCLMIYSYYVYWQCIDRLQLMWLLDKGTLNYDKIFVIKNFFGLTRSLQNFKMSKNQSLDHRARFGGIYIFSKNSEYFSKLPIGLVSWLAGSAADIHSSEKPTKNSTRPNVNEIHASFIHEIKTKGYDVIGINVFHTKIFTVMSKPGWVDLKILYAAKPFLTKF